MDEDDVVVEEEAEEVVAEEKPVTLTKEEVDAREKKLRQSYQKREKKLKAESQASQTKLQELESKLAAFEEQLAAANTPPEEPEAKTEEDKRLQAVQARLDKIQAANEARIAEMQKKLEDAERREQEAAEARRVADRDQKLVKAIADVGTTNMKFAKAGLLPQISWDDVSDTWVYETEDGEVVSIEEGVQRELPEHLRAAKVRSGVGTSQSGGNQPKKATQRKLEAAEAELAEMKRKISERHGSEGRINNQAIADFQRKSREVATLKAELK